MNIALTARHHGKHSVICLELRPPDRPMVWSIMNALFSGADMRAQRRVGKISKDGVRVEIETSLSWTSVLIEIETFFHKLQDPQLVYTSNTLVSLCGRIE